MSKKKQELTPWFPCDVRPHRKGIYEIRYPGVEVFYWYALWRGNEWSWFHDTPDLVMTRWADRPNRHSADDFEWRGLASKP